MYFLKTVFFAALFFVCLKSAFSQEVQVPFDKNSKVWQLDKKTNTRINLFNDLGDFSYALLFQQNDSTYRFEIYYSLDEKLVRHSRVMSSADVATMRNRFEENTVKDSIKTKNQEGRGQLIAGSSLISLGFYGWAIPVILDIRDGRLITGTYMLSSGLGIVVPILTTRNQSVSKADALFAFHGQSRGIAHGTLFSYLFTNNPDIELNLATGIAGSIIEGTAFFQWSKRSGMKQGKAALISSVSDAGALISLGVAHSLGYTKDYSKYYYKIPILVYGGTIAGTLAATELFDHSLYTKGDVWVLRGATTFFSYIPVAILVAIEEKNEQWYSGLASVGAVAGMVYGNILAKKYDYTTSKGVEVCLSELAGGLIGCGLGYLVSTNKTSSQFIAIGSLIGAGIGFGLATTSSNARLTKKDKDVSFFFNVNPIGLLGMNNNKLMPENSNYQPVPLIYGGLRF